ncbi:MAG: dihydrodipicolinate synthase family protein [Clostridia bacterium]|nr:dihydrodipicolinate synthase family protein [Clostridia bacterium]
MQMLTTMITPFCTDGSVDYETALRYVDFYFDSGIDGIFSVCQSSEIFYLSLEERVKLNTLVYRRAKELEKKHGRPFTVVSSGHVSDSLEGQAEELNAIWRSGTDALVLITNRLDAKNEGDDVFIENCRRLIERLPQDARLGLYECPYPYKRLVTPKIFDFCLDVGRFDYMKDTCCDAATLLARKKQLEGSAFRLLNANCQTLYETMTGGGDGYCGIMCNYHPRLYARLRELAVSDPERARRLGDLLGTLGFIENGLPYPMSAKYHMTLCGIPTEQIARKPDCAPLTEYQMGCVRQLKAITDRLEEEFCK